MQAFEMNKLSSNIYYANFSRSEKCVIPKDIYPISTVIIGECGMGKSKLVNNLCGSKHAVGIDNKGITKKF